MDGERKMCKMKEVESGAMESEWGDSEWGEGSGE